MRHATDRLSTAACAASEGGNMTWLIAHRNAVSVLPLPVGARISVDSPRAIAGHPSACGGVGASNDARNQSATAGWKSSRTSLFIFLHLRSRGAPEHTFIIFCLLP